MQRIFFTDSTITIKLLALKTHKVDNWQNELILVFNDNG